MNIVAIHGAWSSPTSFNHLRSQISANWRLVAYDHIKHDIDDISVLADIAITDPCIVIGHSLGGIAALTTHDNPLVKGIITLASPTAGLELNLIQQYLSRSKLISGIARGSRCINGIHAKTYDKPILHCIAGTGFNPFIYEDSDGVLPIKVQTSWTCGPMVKIDANHYEILQHSDTVREIDRFISTVL